VDEDSTGTLRNIHGYEPESPYSGFIMRGAFVVLLRNAGQGVAGMEGSVEEVDSGKEFHFRSEEELIAFLRDCFVDSCRNTSRNEGTK
jgi:hypothetical protein